MHTLDFRDLYGLSTSFIFYCKFVKINDTFISAVKFFVGLRKYL